jgi:hypothetical protein
MNYPKASEAYLDTVKVMLRIVSFSIWKPHGQGVSRPASIDLDKEYGESGHLSEKHVKRFCAPNKSKQTQIEKNPFSVHF